MKYSSGFFSSLFNGSTEVSTGRVSLNYKLNGSEGSCDYIQIRKIRIDSGLVWKTLYLVTEKGQIKIEGLKSADVESLSIDLTKKIKGVINAFLSENSETVSLLGDKFNVLIGSNHYVSQQDIRYLLSTIPEVGKYLSHPMFETSLLNGKVEGLDAFINLLEPNSVTLKKRNENYVTNACEAYAYLFDSLEKYPLSTEQRRAIVVDEDRNLLIAAAGSGKTSTLVGKTIFLIETGLAKPNEILLLSFNKDAQVEIQKRLESLVGVVELYTEPAMARTFHSYGNELVALAEKKKPAIADAAGSSKAMTSLMTEIIKGLSERDKGFSERWVWFTGMYLKPYIEVHSFKNYAEYNDYLRELADNVRDARKERGETRSSFVFESMDGRQVKSVEEARICTWLFLNGVKFEYEQAYEIDTANTAYRQYYPDFFYPEVGLYHEHFALNANGEAPVFFRDYLDGVRWKRELHKERGTTLIETTSAEVYDNTIFENLEKKLRAHGVTFTPLTSEEVLHLAIANDRVSQYVQLFITFLKHFKSNSADIEILRKKVLMLPDRGRSMAFIDIFAEVYREYQAHLDRLKQIDFEDQIEKACSYLESKKVRHGFKYILVDEFQDISQDRKRMLNAMLDENPFIKLFAVGDDWQSIYRFGGADIDIMTDFESHFGTTSQNYLSQTFRSYQGIVDVASEFVQKNPKQIKKEIVSHSDLEGKDLIRIIEYEGSEQMSDQLDKLLEGVNESAKKNNVRLSVFLLGRYRANKPSNLVALEHKFRDLNIEFKTIHESKGLECDYVILLSVNDGYKGFPSKIVDDPLLKLVIPSPEEYPHAEERRLMYVALTRAKRCVFILSRKNFASVFVSELSKYGRVYSPERLKSDMVCPKCNEGKMVKRRSRRGVFFGCSKFPGCKHIMKNVDVKH